jgi:hypothetical protein
MLARTTFARAEHVSGPTSIHMRVRFVPAQNSLCVNAGAVVPEEKDMSKQYLFGWVLVMAGGLSGCSAAPEAQEENLGKSSEALTAQFVGTLGFPADAAYVTSRSSQTWDAFMVQGGLLRYSRYDNGWQADVSLSKPSGVSALRRVTAIPTKTTNGIRLDVFATASDNKIYHRFQTNPGVAVPTFSGWTADLPGNPTVDGNAALAGVSWGNGRIDLFWWTQSAAGHLGHAWADNLVWQGTESGDTPNATHLQSSVPSHNPSSLSVASWGTGRLDIFFGGSTVHHHWFSGNSWGTVANPNREDWKILIDAQTGSLQGAHSVAVRATANASLEMFFENPVPGTLSRIDTASSFSFTNGALNVSRVDIGSNSAGTISNVTRMSSPSRLDIWGTSTFDVWQAFLN